MDVTFLYHILVSMGLFFSFSLILGDILGVFGIVLIIGLFKELSDPVFTMSDMVGNVVGCVLAYLFVIFLLEVLRTNRR